MPLGRTDPLVRNVGPVQKESAVLPAAVQRPPGDKELDQPIFFFPEQSMNQRGRGKIGHHLLLNLLQPPHPDGIIDRPPVVWIDQTQVEQLASLIKIGNAGGSNLHENLREAVEDAEVRNSFLKVTELFQERGRSAGI